MTRDALQQEVVNKIEEQRCNSYVILPTGVGKSRIGMMIAEKVDKYKLPTTIIVPTLKLKQQWEEHIKSWKLKHAEVFVVNTYVKKDSYETGLLLVDEIHTICNKEAIWFNKTIEITKYKYILGLSATLNIEQIAYLESKGLQCAAKYSVQQALKNNWISQFKEYNWLLELSEEDESKYKSINKKYHSYIATFRNNFDVAKSCLKDENFRIEFAEKNNYDISFVQRRAVFLMRSVQERQSFLYNAPCKIKAIKEITSRFKVPTIVFSESTTFADNVADELGDIASAYHSKIKSQIIEGKKYGVKKLKELIIKKLLDDRYRLRVIVTVKELDEGGDFPKLSLAIIASANSKTRKQIQRKGRILRYIPEKQALIINLVIKNTQDEVWLEKRQGNSPGIPIDSLEEIDYVVQ